jgi:hypothetical protein
MQSGAAIQFSVKSNPPVVRVIERIIGDSSVYLSLHTLKNGPEFAPDTRLTQTMLLKANTGNALAELWRGGSFSSQSQRGLGKNPQFDCYRLHFVRQALGVVEIGETIAKIGGKWTMIDPPMVFVLADSISITRWGWPIELHCVRDTEVFVELLKSAGLEVPVEIEQGNNSDSTRRESG